MRNKVYLCILLLAALLLPLSGGLAEGAQPTESLDTLPGLQAYLGAGKRVGVKMGTTHERIAQQLFPDAQLVYYNNGTDEIMALETDKIDAYMVDQPQGYAQCLTNDALWMTDAQLLDDDYGIALPFGQEALCEQVNAILLRMRAEGALDALSEKWFLTDEAQKPLAEVDLLPADKGTLRLTTTGDNYPFAYVRDGQPVGYSVELVQRLCEELGYGLRIQIADFSGMIAAVSSGKTDFAAACISITEERREQMLFTEPIYVSGVRVMLPASQRPARSEKTGGDFSTVEEMQRYFTADKTLGIQVGTTHDGIAARLFPNVQRAYYNSTADLLLALESGKLDGYMVEQVQGRTQCRTDEQLWMPDAVLEETSFGMALSFGHEALCAQLDELLLRMRGDGTLDALEDKWFQADEAQKSLTAASALPAAKGTLKLSTTGDDYPFAYVRDGQPVGYSVELTQLLCKELGYGLDIQVTDFAGMIAAVSSGKADMATSCISITDERKEQMLFTEPIYVSGECVMLPASLRTGQTATDDLTTVAGLQAYFTADKQLGMQSGTIHDQTAMKYFPDAQRVYTPGSSDLVAALTAGRIDGYLVDQPQGYAQCLSDDRLWMPDVRIEEDNYGIALAFGQEALCGQLNTLIGQMKAAGELDALSDKWFLTDEAQKPMTVSPGTGEKGVLRLATSADSYPFSYMREGQAVGYSVELFGLLCRQLGYGYEVQVYDFGGMIAAVAAGKADAASDSISITAERKEQMLFTDPTYHGGVAMVLPAALKPQSGASAELSTAEGAFGWLRGKRVGLFIGATLPADVEEKLSASEQVWLNNNVDMMSALTSGKIDCFLCEVPIARQICAGNEGLYTPETILIPEAYAFALREDSAALTGLLNDFLRKLTADGTLEKLQVKWERGDPAERVMPQVTLTGENGTLTIATDAADAPFGYVQNGELVGYDYELLTLFAKEYGYALHYLQIAWDALPAAVVSGKCDIACGCLSITDEHAEHLLMTDPTYRSGVTLVMSDQYAPVAAVTEEPKEENGWAAFAASISASFERTFLRENRWMLIVQGLLTTLQISVLSALLGTLLG
ncbi:MAG: transporter substrate-binding domain-containing protein, partial [Eubacteriales bacterium]|nr:transporter substrate-binding domain-containing protein [Eubacteriales bacterium]